MRNELKLINLPWSSWYESQNCEIYLPANWEIDWFSIKKLPQISKASINNHVNKLVNLIKEKRPNSIAFAVDDLTRPLSYENVFNCLLSKLRKLPFFPSIKIIIGLGTHGPLSPIEFKWKLGENIFQYPDIEVRNHNCYEDLKDAKFLWGNKPVKINRFFFEADFRVILSTVVPHPFAGFSGGIKMILPGLSNIDIIKRTHQMALMGFAGKAGEVQNNKFRAMLNQIISHIPVDFFMGFLVNNERICVGMESGPIFEAYRRIVNKAKKLYQIPLPQKQYDIIWLNAYPKDTELVQIDSAFLPILSTNIPFWHKNSIFIISAACRKGIGSHGLFAPGGLLYRLPREKRFLMKHRVYFFLPNISKEEFYQLYWEGYSIFTDSKELISNLLNNVSEYPSVALFDTASISFISSSLKKEI